MDVTTEGDEEEDEREVRDRVDTDSELRVSERCSDMIVIRMSSMDEATPASDYDMEWK